MPPGSSLFSLEEGAHFLNHGSFGACPVPVQAEQDRWRARMEAQPVRFMVRELPDALARARAAVAAALGATEAGLVFVDNASTGVNAVLRSLRLSPGDELLTTDHVYGAVRQTLRWVAERAGAHVIEAAVPLQGVHSGAFATAIAEALTPRTRLVVIDHITSPSGLVVHPAPILAACHAAGVPVLVDGAHAPGQLPLDLAALGADFYTGNLHKWAFAPRGTAILHVAEPHRDRVHPTVISHGLGQGLHAEFDWTGTRDPTAWLAAPEGLRVHAALGGPELMRANHTLAWQMGQRLAARWGTSMPAPEDMVGSMATVALPTDAPGELAPAVALHDALWDQHRIEVPIIPLQGRLWVRISAQTYNHPEQYDALADAVSRVQLT